MAAKFRGRLSLQRILVIAATRNQISRGYGCVMVQTTSFRELIPILQLSIGPVILISGVGLLLLTLTNRFGRLLELET